MPSRRKRRIKTRQRYHIFVILFLTLAGVFLLYRVIPEIPRELPKVAIVIDDLGPNRKVARAILEIDAPLTLSILPHEVYTSWIAEEGYKRGYEIIAHIPMEAQRPHRLGKGGLYTGMTDREISLTLKGDIQSIPHIKGFSNHMGSAFTEDERAMHIVISVARRHGLFFLDSLTTPKSVGVRIAKEQGVEVLQRDVFLDVKDDPDYIEAQWAKVLKIARKRGYAIALCHPRINTIEFLKKVLINNNEIIIVPLSELLSYNDPD